ncbi:MAG: UDP-N-acetylmuramoyl-tripeptide--D-alanyl-D-alanine ligase [Bacteroidales bacterium]|nr:UDP-N-acetylmuramoyl-tripeptide--D-alanyl-D-alanine ligase [Bacteroidales bacterium]
MNTENLYSLFRQSGCVTTDSRTIKGGEIFFALKGENFDGNLYAEKALEMGASYAVVDADSEAATKGNEKIIPVENTLDALQKLAAYHRVNVKEDGSRLPVVGLTGTNGKTTTKELIRSVLSSKYNVTATQGNLNNDIGVPLSLLKITPDTEIAVIEMGASHPDDIAKLIWMVDPDLGLITNVGKAHLLGFGSFEGVKKAKGVIYDYICEHGGNVLVNMDDRNLTEMASERDGLKTIGYGISFEGAEVIPSSSEQPFLRMKIGEYLLETNLVGSYNANNVMAAIAVGKQFGVELKDAIDAIAAYVPTNNRSQMTKTENNSLVVDAYNANPSSMAAALDNFALDQSAVKVALLGDMRELGEESVKEHEAIVKRLSEIRLDKIHLVGEEFGKALDNVGKADNVCWFKTSEELASFLSENPVKGATILVKGSRGIQMEKAIPQL